MVSFCKVFYVGFDGYFIVYYIWILIFCGFVNRNEFLWVVYVDEVIIELGVKEIMYYLKLVKVDKMDKGKD